MYWVKINPFYRFDLFHVVKLFQTVRPSLKDLLSDPYILIASGMFKILYFHHKFTINNIEKFYLAKQSKGSWVCKWVEWNEKRAVNATSSVKPKCTWPHVVFMTMTFFTHNKVIRPIAQGFLPKKRTPTFCRL